ncbi:unnamed protein product [Phyllotreta striolata]|uniref:Enoyl reductase (ER) domain-containing protein n=1 Tax=Phyllotreta striolata TaxID=444603 RepID=A0A9N9XVT0_PHYSR|nr:unnamed protein product [Phyllotreta striolata]
MDELIFRSTQKFENFQVQSRLFALNAKDYFIVYVSQGKILFEKIWTSPQVVNFKMNMEEGTIRMIEFTKEIKTQIMSAANPKQIYIAMLNVFGKKWTTRDICFTCGGLVIGGVIGFAIGFTIKKRQPILQYMQAIRCSDNMGPESINVVEDARAPHKCGDYGVLVNVKAASIQLVDVQISHGYGRNLRRILQKVYLQSQHEEPVILGRDCTGIVTDIGAKVTKLEVGDEVWLTVPFWAQGTLCQTVMVPENRVARKPKNVGFDGASSIPYAGSLALSTLVEARLDSMNAEGKKILIHGGCTPVGCVLVQLLHQWKASVTVTCYKRSLPVAQALGASDALIVSESTTHDNLNFNEDISRILNELEERDQKFDVILITENYCELSKKELGRFLEANGMVLSTLPPLIPSDNYGVISNFLLYTYIYLRYKLQNLLGLPINTYDETHLCSVTLDKLSEFVEDGYVQTVVDKIYQPQDIEIAVNHIQSPYSIGSTIITFR